MGVRLRDVAELAGVSVMTVSNVVNDVAHVRPAMRARVQKAIDELDYQPNLSARHLRQSRTGMIGLAVPDLSVPYFAELAGHVLRAARRRGFTLLIDQTEGDPERELMLIQRPRSTFVDGLILSPLAIEAGTLSARLGDTPVVLLGERTYDLAIDHVAIDNVNAALTATNHLAEFGCRRVAAIGAPQDNAASPMAEQRLRGYREAVTAGKLSSDKRLVVATDWFTRADGYDATMRLMHSGARPDGLFCLNDLLALGALRALADLGLRVPQDVAVIGIDGIEDGEYSIPTLSTIAPDKAQIASKAVDLLAARISGSATAGSADFTAAFSLVPRQSTQ